MSASPPTSNSPTSRKRPFDAIDGPSPSKDPANVQSSVPSLTSLSQFANLPTPPAAQDISPSSTTSSPLSSPAPSSRGSVLGDLATPTNHPSPQPAKLALPTPAKKRKLTLVEKEARRLEKEAKDRQKAEEKARKDEERSMKEEDRRRKREEEEEEKRKRELEKAEKKKVKDAEIQRKEDEKRKKEEEKNKRERSQLRIGSFFIKPSARPAAPVSPGNGCGDLGRILEGEDLVGIKSCPASPSKPVLSEYQRTFPPFFLQSHTALAPLNRFTKDEETLGFKRAALDSHIKSATMPTSLPIPPSAFNAFELFKVVPRLRRRDLGVPVSVKDILIKMQGSKDDPIDATNPANAGGLKSIPMKVLHFREDVRPPYQGTFTKAMSPRSVVRVSKNPFYRALPDTNYDYDSEAEWEEPEEGEDLGSEIEEDGSEDGADDLEGFLDDEEDPISGKRRQIVGDLEPWSSGLCWESRDHGLCSTTSPDIDLESYRMEVVLGSAKIPINPFSTAYWQAVSQPQKALELNHSGSAKPMNPPRIPLHVIYQTNTAVNKATHAPLLSQEDSIPKPTLAFTNAPQESSGTLKPKRMIADNLLPQFKQAVQGSNLTKAGLIEVLKKQFPKVSKDVIKDTLNAVAMREGKKEADKRWVVTDDGAVSTAMA